MRQRLWIPPFGIIRTPRVRRILGLAGWRLSSNPFGADAFAGWGRKPTGRLAGFLARLFGKPSLQLEDGFLRSVGLGLAGAEPLSLIIDDMGVYYDAAAPSRLEHLLQYEPLDEPELLTRAAKLRARLRKARISKYNVAQGLILPPEAGDDYVLVIDQRAGDQSIRSGGADEATFRDMLAAARQDYPGHVIVIKTHPDADMAGMKGYFAEQTERVVLAGPATNPWVLIEEAAHVYTVSSQMGFEALMAEKPVTVFGRPFYAGWGLSIDRQAFARRSRRLAIDQLTAAALILLPTYYDPEADALCDAETVAARLEAGIRAKGAEKTDA